MHEYRPAISTSECMAFMAEEIGYGQKRQQGGKFLVPPLFALWYLIVGPTHKNHCRSQVLNLHWSSTDWNDGLKPTRWNVTDVNVKCCMWVPNLIAQYIHVGWQLLTWEQSVESNWPHVGACSLLFPTGKKTMCRYYLRFLPFVRHHEQSKMEQPVWPVETSLLLNWLKKEERTNTFGERKFCSVCRPVFCDSVTCYSFILFQINVLHFVIFIYS